MEPPQTAYLYKETRLNLEPAFSASTIAISLPTASTSFLSRSQPKRTILTDSFVEQDEATFARRNLATEASLFFRRHHKYPRAFLWRILDDRKVLEIRATDASSEKFSKEATLTLLLEFPTQIKPFGVAFAEPVEKDALAVFALTTANELYSITLPRDFFVRPQASETDVSEWCRTFVPSSFSFRQPYRMVAVSTTELLISLHDGGLLRLTRQASDDGSAWRESFFSEGGWGTSFKNLIPWKGPSTIRFENVDLEASTAAAIGVSPGGTHIFSVCLNHSLKAWNLHTGRIGVQTDILGENVKDAQKHAQYFITPSQPQLMQIVDVPGAVDGDEYVVVTYSPKHHQFKFWAILDPDSPDLGIRDASPNVSFIPPMDDLMNTNVWNLEEFHVKAGPGWKKADIWIRARSGPNSKVFTLEFELNDSQEDLEAAWRNNWFAVDSGALTVENLKASPDYPGERSERGSSQVRDTSERWLDFLFFPGRFSVASLETALSIFSRIPGRSKSTKSASLAAQRIPLKERLCNAIISNVPPHRQHGETTDFDAYDSDLGKQWQVYYGLVRDLHKRRGAALSLVFDEQEGMPWLLLADYVSVIRKCSDIEVITSNGALFANGADLSDSVRSAMKLPDQQGLFNLLYAAHEFRRALGDEFQDTLKVAVDREIFRERGDSVLASIQGFNNFTNLCSQVTDEDVNRLIDSFEYFDAYSFLSTDVFRSALDLLAEPERGHHIKREITHFGLSTLVRISQETLQVGYETLLDLLVLVVFMCIDVHPDELANDFDGQDLFLAIITQLREYTLLRWLSSTTRMNPPAPKPRRLSGDGSMELDASQTTSRPVPMAETMLETMCKDFCFAIEFPTEPPMALLTYWGRAWTFSPLLNKTARGIACDVMSALLAHKQYDLAQDFAKFLNNDAWPTYLRARLELAKGDWNLAAVYFKKAGFGLAEGFFDVNETEGLLSPEEKDYFAEGLPRYYQHVFGLFERVKVYSYVADFARLALQSLAAQNQKPEDAATLQTEFLSRLFNASLQTSRFEEAYSSLTRYTNKTLRKQALTQLVTTMVAQNQASTLLHLPFSSLSGDVDKILEHLCQKTVNISTGPPYHKILFSWRISRNDFRGASSVLYERLQRLKSLPAITSGAEIVQCYLLLINTLATVDPDQQWILVEQPADEPVPSMKQLAIGKGKSAPVVAGARKIMTLEDVRAEYQAELDKQSAVEHGRFAFGGQDEMEM